jgi:hypothetical protein
MGTQALTAKVRDAVTPAATSRLMIQRGLAKEPDGVSMYALPQSVFRVGFIVIYTFVM